MSEKAYSFTGKVWLYEGPAAWHFVTLPQDIARDIEQQFGHLKRGWGSLAVSVEIRGVRWTTSIFTDKKSQSFLMPLKAKVRQLAKIGEGDEIAISLTVKPESITVMLQYFL